MFIYNITCKVDISICTEWKRWQLDEHIPEIMSSKLFTDFKFYKLLDQDESEGETYVLQLFFLEKNNYETYINGFAPVLRDKAITKWGNRFIAYRTVMESVQ